MAIYHLSVKPVTRSSGRSAVAAAAYRAAERLTNARDGLTHDFTEKRGVVHAEVVLPAGGAANWARDRSALWNAAETAERRKDACVAREIEVALPNELTTEERLALVRDFVGQIVERYGVAVDFALHAPHEAHEVRNHHAHILLTSRVVGPEGLGEKSALERDGQTLAARGLPSRRQQLAALREDWEETANRHLARAGHDIRIDRRSHLDRGLEIEPTRHIGVAGNAIGKRGEMPARERLDAAGVRWNTELLLRQPEQVLRLVADERSVFGRRDLERAVYRYVAPEEAKAVMARVMASPVLVEVQAERRDVAGRVIAAPRYSTREMIETEGGMAKTALGMAGAGGFRVAERHVVAALARQDRAIRQAGGEDLSAEQRAAVEHVTGSGRLAAVVGLAGAGKSTMLTAAREAWEAAGYTVKGAALAGKAAEGLEESSGIASRTLASWELSWQNERHQLGPHDVLVIDEAGMIGSRQMARVIDAAGRAGAKAVLVGDPEQLQPIGPGAAFRALAERTGYVELEGVRRQREDWQRAASVDFARQRTAAGLAAYAERGGVIWGENAGETRAAVVRDYLADMEARPEGSRLALSHRRADVQGLNEAIRTVRQERGELAGEVTYATTEGARAFAPGDRLLFRQNDRDLAVKNGMIGTVTEASEAGLSVRVEGSDGPRSIEVDPVRYAAIDHGYAVTIHKSQGVTVDRTFVLASKTMDRHLTYVGMTRHRDSTTLFADRREFSDDTALAARLSRDGAKETTLDYSQDFAARRSLTVVKEHAARETGYARRPEPAAANKYARGGQPNPYSRDPAERARAREARDEELRRQGQGQGHQRGRGHKV